MIHNSEENINFFISNNPNLKDFKFERIKGGKNNKAFLLKNKSGKKFFLKQYYHSKNDDRNRLKSEWDFIDFIDRLNINQTPKNIYKDDKLGLGLYSFVNGKKIENNEILEEHIKQIANFIIAINNCSQGARFSNFASDYNSSIQSFIKSVDWRVKNLIFSKNLNLKFKNKLIQLKNTINRLWRNEKNKINSEFSLSEIKQNSQLYLSPSDIGFHNILIDKKKLFFIDFEYSGLDDLVKLINDFFICPSASIPNNLRENFILELNKSFKFDNFFYRRLNILEKAYKIKWSCILLNEYLTNSEARRKFSNEKEKNTISYEQYDKSLSLLLS